MARFVERRARFRIEQSAFGEAKGGGLAATKFLNAIEVVREQVLSGELLVACSIIDKSRYRGAWLHATPGSPPSPTFLRNYLVRKTIEFAFDGRLNDRCSADLILDRVDYSDEHIRNLRQYLAGKYSHAGGFTIPRITHVTHADSLYVDGLQVADHVMRLAYGVATKPTQSLQPASGFISMQTILGQASDG